MMRYYWETIDECVAPPLVLEALQASGFKEVSRDVEVAIFSEYRGVR